MIVQIIPMTRHGYFLQWIFKLRYFCETRQEPPFLRGNGHEKSPSAISLLRVLSENIFLILDLCSAITYVCKSGLSANNQLSIVKNL